MTSCSIIKGDLPLKIWWRFIPSDDGLAYNLSTNTEIIISRTSQRISILAIEAVKARHRGNYTCFAQNTGGSSQFSTYLAMNGWIFNSFAFNNSSKLLKNFAV